MTAADYNACETRLLRHEGSDYTDGVHPYDPGGPTRYGITLADVRQYLKPGATAEDVQALTLAKAKAIYRTKYWATMRCDDLPAGVDDVVFDYAVNSGFGRAGKVLRRVVGAPDAASHVTDDVIAQVKRVKPDDLIDAICDERLRFLASLKIWPIYKNGWTTRVAEVRAFAHALAQATPLTLPTPDPNVQIAGKGQVPAPTASKTTSTGTIIATGTAVAHASGWDVRTTAIVALVCIFAGLIAFALLNLRAKFRQEAAA